VALDAEAQRVILDDGSSLDYDALLVATGASPKRLDGDLAPDVAAEICYLRTIGDARHIKKLAEHAHRAVVFGAGLVSMQVAGAIARPDLHVTCVVASRQVLSQNVDRECAELLRRHIERSANVSFTFGANVVGIAKARRGFEVALDNGARLSVELLVAGKGVAPNIDFVDRRQIDVDQGILVDEHLRSSVPNVFAAGDLAQVRNRLSDRRELVANWINACQQGRIAGLNMAGSDEAFPGSVPENVTTLFGAPVASIGIIRQSREGPRLREVHYSDEARGVYRKLFYRGERLVGAVLLRDIADAGLLRNAIVAGGDAGCSEEDAAAGRTCFASRLRTCWRGTQPL
jgi:NAD(P)H-nitrite reductase large subunit